METIYKIIQIISYCIYTPTAVQVGYSMPEDNEKNHYPFDIIKPIVSFCL